MKVEIKTVCPAHVYERWQVDLPDEQLPEDELRDAAHEALWAGEAELIDDAYGGEHDREIVRLAPRAPGPP